MTTLTREAPTRVKSAVKAKRVVHWHLPPADGNPATREEFREMIQEARKEQPITYEQHKENVHKWLVANL